MRAIVILAGLAWSLAGALAPGGTIICPNTSSGILTLQDALDVAGDGDVILILKGEYRGNFTVSDKENLTLRGVAKVVLDARPLGSASVGPALWATACPGLRIEGLEIRNAGGSGADGAGLRLSGSDLVTVDSVEVKGCESYGILAEQCELLRVRDCEVRGNSGGISVAGNFAELTRVTIESDSVQGVQIFGSDAALVKCKVSVIRGGSGIDISGDRPTVKKCEVNAVLDKDSSGIATSGAEPDLRGNLVTGCDTGIFVIYGAYGMVKGNDVRDCWSSGIRTGGVSHDLEIVQNLVKRCGSPTDPGFWLDGAGHVLTANRAERCGGDGFHVFASGMTLIDNAAVKNLRDGFDVEASVDGTRLDDNLAEGNAAEGIENSGTATVLKGNVAKKNRIDFASDGTNQDEGGNNFDVAGAPAPELD